MSDKLEKCVCGGNGFNYKYIIGEKRHVVKCDDSDCTCETPCCTTEIEAYTAWQTMQRALKSGWSSEVPTEIGHYMFIGSYEGRFENVVLTVPVYAKLSMAYTDETGKTPDGVVARINGFTGWPDQFNGLWFRINYPAPPKD